MAYKVTVAIDHDCPLSKLQQALNMTYEVYCNGFYDYFIFQKEITDEQVELLSEILFYDIINSNHSSAIYQPAVILPCNGEDRDHLMHFYRFFSEGLGVIFAFPQITDQGEIYLYHCLDVKIHSDLLDNMQNNLMFEIQSIEEYPIENYYQNYLFSIPDLASRITNRQMQILAEAYNGGYYRIPRSIRTEDIATRNQTSRYNIDKLLRSVERKIMQFIYPFLK